MKQQILITCIIAALAVACGKDVDKPRDETEHDAINSIALTFRLNGNVVGTFVAEDPDGDGGNPPTRIDQVTLQANQTYTVEVSIRNVSGGNIKDLTEGIRQQGRHHELYFIPTGVSVNITKTDKDQNNLPIGLASTWTTGAAGTGSVLVKLMHKPFVKGINDAPTFGHTDLAINMPATIQ